MWFYPLLLLALTLALSGGVLLGGVYTIVLVPIAGVALVSAIVYALWGRSLQGSRGVSTHASSAAHRPLPTQASASAQSGAAGDEEPATPEALVDARRTEQ